MGTGRNGEVTVLQSVAPLLELRMETGSLPCYSVVTILLNSERRKGKRKREIFLPFLKLRE